MLNVSAKSLFIIILYLAGICSARAEINLAKGIKSSQTQNNDLIEKTLDQNRLNELSFLRQEQISDYNKIIILDYIIQHFQEEDWISWPSAFKKNSPEPTKMRELVDSISVINENFAKYLETAFYLFTRVRANYNADTKKELNNFYDNANDFYSFRNNPAISPQESVDTEILNDTVFLQSLDAFRYKEVRELINQGSISENRIFELADLFSPSSAPSVARELIKYVALSLSPSQRIKAVESIKPNNILFEVIDTDSGLSKALSNLYALLSVDFVEQGDIRGAKKAFKISNEITTGENSQLLVSNFINNIPSSSENSEDPKKSKKSGFSNLISKSSSSTSFGGFLKYTIIFVFILFIFAVVLVFSRRRAKRKASNSYLDEPIEDKKHDEEIEFDDLEFFPSKQKSNS